MNTIAILTDLSEGADQTARYALHLAQHLNSNLLLYNSFLIPSAEPLAAQIAWPLENYNELRQDTEQRLELLAERLRDEALAFPVNAFDPKISCKCCGGTFTLNINELLADKHVALLVMGSHKKGLAAFMVGNHIRQIMDDITLPVLILPDHQQFRKITRIAFATDLSYTDVDVVKSLAGIANPTGAEITLVHISPETGDRTDPGKQIRAFLQEVKHKVAYPHIVYRNVMENHVEQGLHWLTEHLPFDMLVMVHRNKSFLQQIFHHSNTQRMAGKISIPLLVYPYPAANLPAFG